MPFDFPAPATPGQIFEPNGAGTEPKFTYNGAAWDYGATTELLISSVIPNAAICGSAAIPAVRALGANFTATCEILFDGTPVATTFVSVSELTFPINPVPETVPRTAVITVRDGATIGVGAVPFAFRIVTTYEWNIGIDETSPGTIDVQPANFTPGEIGGITSEARSATQGLLLDEATGHVTAPLATPLLAGVLTEPPDDSKGYVRQTTGASSTWVPPATTPLPEAGIGLTVDATTPPGILNLDIANTNGEIGGVMTEPRTDIQGLDMTATGLITVPLATPTLAGAIVEPVADAKGYVRTTQLNGVSQWVPPAAAVLPDFGTGLTLDTSSDPDIVNLQPAGDSPATLGGVYVIDRVRNVSEGLELGIDGRLRAPLATESLAGTILEPPPDDKGYVRRRDLMGVSAWVPPADPAPPPLSIVHLNPNTVQVGSAPLTIEVHGTKFTAATTVNFGTATPAVTFVSPTELTFEIDPALETVRTVSVTINDSGLPGQGDAPFYFRASDKLYQGTWEPVTNTPDILTISKQDGWMWIVDTVDPRTTELVPTTIPGIAGMEVRESDHVIWDATATAFRLVGTRQLTITDIVPSQALIGSPAIDVQIYGAGFTAATRVLWEGVPVTTQFLDDTKLRIRVDPATAVIPARGFVVVGVDELGPPAVAGRGAAGFQFLEKVVVQPAGNTGPEIGVVYIPDNRGLDISADGSLTLLPASDNRLGGIFDASAVPADKDKTYSRKFGQWVENKSTDLKWGLGLTEDPAGTIILEPAGNAPTQLGGVYTLAGKGATVTSDGGLSIIPATPNQLGIIVDAPYDAGKNYVRSEGKWIESKATAYTWGIGLDETAPGVIDLRTANFNSQIGGVTLIGRGPTQGLEYDAATGLVTAPLATDVLAGAIVDAPGDDKLYARSRTAAGVSSWKEATSGATISDTPPPNPFHGQLWWESDTGKEFIWFDDGSSAQWVQISGGGGGTGGAIPDDAPSDTKMYGRKSATNGGAVTWTEVVGGAGGITEAPTDGQSYARRGSDTSWQPVTATGGIAEAPTDGQQYTRGNTAWNALTAATLPPYSVPIADVPPTGAQAGAGCLWWNSATGFLYIRYNNQWVDTSKTAASIP